LTPILENLAQYLEKIHNNFTNKIEAVGLEKAVTFYLQVFLNNADKKKFKSGDVFLLLNCVFSLSP